MEGIPNPASSASSVASSGSNGRGNAGEFKLGGMFGTGHGELPSTFGGSLMNGSYGLENTETNPATSSFDLADFPSLDGTPSSANQNGLAAALRQQQQQLLAQRHMLSGMSSSSSGGGGSGGGGSSEGAWPALPGAAANARTNGTNSPFLLRTGSDAASSHDKSPNVSRPPSTSSSGAFYTGTNGANDVVDNTLDGQQQVSLHQQRSSTPSSTGAPSAPSGSSSGGGTGSTLSREYGLLGLLSLIRMPDSDRKKLALGTDLTLFGQLENPQSKEPHYQLPICYYMQAPSLKTGHLSKFQLETLFYIFYSQPKDALQAYAAQELYVRGWRYHVELETWFKEVGPSDGVNVSAGSGPQYMYFDINSWERRLCNTSMNNKNIASGFFPEEETRVKYPSS